MSPFRQLSSLVLLLCLFSCSALASSASLKPDLRILIDVSGGMKTSDPRNRRGVCAGPVGELASRRCQGWHMGVRQRG